MASSFKEKVDALTQALGIAEGESTIVERVDAIAAQVGLSAELKGKPLIEKIDICYETTFGSTGAKAAGQLLVGTSIPMATTLGTPIPMVMGQRDAAAAPPDELAAWVSAYTIIGGPRPDQHGAYGWFDSTFGESAWPLQRAAMRGEIQKIRDLCAEGHDPNVKMSAWYDSEPLGWVSGRALISGPPHDVRAPS